MRVVELWRFPVKSFAGEHVERVAVGPLGLEGDRQWALFDERTGKYLTARRQPPLLFATARLRDDGTLDARLPDGSPATDASLSAWLERPVRLVHAADDLVPVFENPLDAEHDADWVEWTGPSGVFHDAARNKLSLVSRDTTGDWDQRRFRTNVIVDVGPELELAGRTVRIGSTVLSVNRPISRCVMVTRPQYGLQRDLDVLRTVNKAMDGKLAIGATVIEPGEMAVGDEVEVVD